MSTATPLLATVSLDTVNELFCVQNLVQAQPLPYNAKAVAILGRALGDFEVSPYDSGLLCFAAKTADRSTWYKVGEPTYVVIPGHDGSYNQTTWERMPNGYPGYDAWRQELVEKHGVVPDQITSCIVRPGHEKITHSREETDGFVLRAQERGWQRAIAVASPHQIVRVMGHALYSMQDLGYKLDLVPMIPEKVDWLRPVYGSLGAQKLPRWQQCAEETKRNLTYPDCGYMVPVAELKMYLLQLYERLQNEQ